MALMAESGEFTFTHGDPAARCVTTLPAQGFFDIQSSACACGQLRLNFFVRPETLQSFLTGTFVPLEEKPTP